MTPSEFKAWFEGFTEAVTGAPTKAQWERIKARVAEIDGKPVSYPVYIDRYVRPYYGPYYNTQWATTGAAVQGGLQAYAQAANCARNVDGHNAAAVTFDSHAAMREFGRAESVARG